MDVGRMTTRKSKKVPDQKRERENEKGAVGQMYVNLTTVEPAKTRVVKFEKARSVRYSQ
jgi:hypothetical protein